MRGRVTSCECGSVRREGACVYINVSGVGLEGLTVWKREKRGGAGVYSPVVIADLVGNTGEWLLSLPALAASIKGVLAAGGSGRFPRMPGMSGLRQPTSLRGEVLSPRPRGRHVPQGRMVTAAFHCKSALRAKSLSEL